MLGDSLDWKVWATELRSMHASYWQTSWDAPDLCPVHRKTLHSLKLFTVTTTMVACFVRSPYRNITLLFLMGK